MPLKHQFPLEITNNRPVMHKILKREWLVRSTFGASDQSERPDAQPASDVSSRDVSPRFFWGLAVALSTVALLGCNGTPPAQQSRDTDALSGGEYFENAQASVVKMYEFDSIEDSHQAVYYFNTWLGSQDTEATWTPAALLGSLPPGLQAIPELQDVSRTQVELSDMREIRTSLWLRDIAEWVLARRDEALNGAAGSAGGESAGGESAGGESAGGESAGGASPEMFRDMWVEHLAKESRGDAEILDDVLCLFDWTVRNVQLLPPPPQAPPVDPSADVSADVVEFKGFAGVGYLQLPDDTILMGVADVWERAEVFLGLLRQRQIPAAVLAFRVDGRLKPWACGVAIGKHVYLLDPQLGLPLAVFGEGRLATLAELVESPEKFRRYDVGSTFVYPFAIEEGAEIVALVSAPPFSLTRAAQLIQSRMTGQQHWRISMDAAGVAAAFTKTPAVVDAQLWAQPIQWQVYVRLLNEERARNTELANRYQAARFVFDEGPLPRARKLHIRGLFEKHDGGQSGALIFYRDLRQTEEAIAGVATNRFLLKLLGIRQDRYEAEDVFAAQIRVAQRILLMSREHASYFLGLVNYETGNFATSANWLERRTLDDFPQGEWRFGAKYNLARALERAGDWERARSILLVSESPQRHGDLLRARLIRTDILRGKAANSDDTSPKDAVVEAK
jgi:hypothetical protein